MPAPERRCGTCSWWAEFLPATKRLHAAGRCLFPMPDWPTPDSIVRENTLETDGATCPTWEARIHQPEEGE